MRDDEPRVRSPRIRTVAALSSTGEHPVSIEYHARQPEPLLELVAPLQNHRRRTRDDRSAHLLPYQKLSKDQPRLDRLAESDVVGDEQVDARKEQSLP